VHLMGTFVDSKSSARHKRMALEFSQWEHVTFKAKISRTSDKVIYQVIIKHLASIVMQISLKIGEFLCLILKLSVLMKWTVLGLYSFSVSQSSQKFGKSQLE